MVRLGPLPRANPEYFWIRQRPGFEAHRRSLGLLCLGIVIVRAPGKVVQMQLRLRLLQRPQRWFPFATLETPNVHAQPRAPTDLCKAWYSCARRLRRAVSWQEAILQVLDLRTPPEWKEQ